MPVLLHADSGVAMDGWMGGWVRGRNADRILKKKVGNEM